MKLKFILMATCLLQTFGLAIASFDQAPANFSYKDGMAVFVDFTDATHEITYDFINKTVTVNSTIDFTSMHEGHPIFDLVPNPEEVTLNARTVTTDQAFDPDLQTVIRVVQEKIPAGNHQLKMTHTLKENVIFDEKGIASAFWLSDLNDRRYLELYLPSNMEYDQHRRQLKVNLIGVEGIPHVLKANGKVLELNENSFEVTYPEFYSSSSAYFHLFPEKSIVQNVQFYYPSIDGRMIPVDIYSIVDIDSFVELTKDTLAELEADYGPFPHNEILIYGNSLAKGGMEYSGATVTGLLSLGHELFHSYNARGVMPANGNAGWMDEAMARWRDNKYPLIKELTFDSARLGGHSEWRRFTDRMAYTEGSAFLSSIAYKMNDKGLNLKTFLKDFFQKYMHTTVTTEQFEKELTDDSGLYLADDFNRYIYGKGPVDKSLMRPGKQHGINPHHPKFTAEELHKMTMP